MSVVKILALIENMFDWHLIVPDVCPVEEEFLFVLLLFWICFFQFVFVCLFICVCVCVHMHAFPTNSINTSFHTSLFLTSVVLKPHCSFTVWEETKC